jgi:hypothetical protein
VKGLGYILIAVGFLAGSVIAVQTEENRIDWIWFLPALAVATAGVTMARIAIAGRNRHGEVQQDNIGSLNSSIDTIVERIRQLDAENADLDPYDVHGRIDELFPAALTTFVDARETIGHVFGLQAYAAVMNEFAAGERYLNRVWSASVDGYIDEVREYIGRSRSQFEATREKLLALQTADGKS